MRIYLPLIKCHSRFVDNSITYLQFNYKYLYNPIGCIIFLIKIRAIILKFWITECSVYFRDRLTYEIIIKIKNTNRETILQILVPLANRKKNIKHLMLYTRKGFDNVKIFKKLSKQIMENNIC